MNDRAIEVLAVAFILAALVIGMLGCSVAWTRLPDPRPGVSRYEVTVTRGVGADTTGWRTEDAMKDAVKHCMFCGKPVSDGDWDYVGADHVWVCSSFECLVERSDAHRAAQEEAQLDAMEDGYGRYLR